MMDQKKFERLLEIVYGIEYEMTTVGEMEEAVGILRTEINELIVESIKRRMTPEQREALSRSQIQD